MIKFKYFIIWLIILLSIFCIYGWYIVLTYVNDFEITITKEDISLEMKEEDIEEYNNLCFEVSINYAKYISGEIEFKDIKKYLSSNTDTYNHLNEFNNNKFTSFDSSEILNEEIVSLNLVDNEVLCEVKFDYIIYIDEDYYQYQSHYYVSFNNYNKLIESIIMK